jgi:PIN domain nuclease of toxin-antitoxin system
VVRDEVIYYLDTHVLVRICQGEVSKLGREARKAIDRNEVLASAAAILELEMLHEIGRLKITAPKALAMLATDIGLRVCDMPFRTIVDHALTETWTRDPFDRLIVANAKAAGAPLVTKDERILGHYSRALW